MMISHELSKSTKLRSWSNPKGRSFFPRINRPVLMRLFHTTIFCVLSSGFAFSQTNVYPQPDCQIVASFTASGQVSPASGRDNRTCAATTWALVVAVSGFSSATVALQSAPDNAGAPGTWVTYAGATIFSATPDNVNPIVTSTQQFVWLTGYNPWVRIALTAATGSGTVYATAFGWRLPSSSSTGGGGGGSSNVTIVGPLGQTTESASIPVTIASDQSACQGTTPCARTFNLLTTSGAQQVVAGVSGKSTYIYKRYVTTAGGENFIWTSASAGSCGGTTATLDEQLSVAAAAFDDNGTFIVGPGLNLCINPSAVQNATVTVLYVQF